jgi:hypothetical protein
MSSGGGGDGGAAAARQREQERQQQVREARARVDRIFSGGEDSPGAFGDDYFNQYQQDYLGYYKPQLEKKRNDAREQLTHQLADRGVLESSVANKRFGDLTERYGERMGELQNKAETAVAQKRSDVEQARTSLYNLAQSSADPSLAASQAQARVSSLKSPPQYSPIGNVFADLINSGANVVRAERAGQPGLGTGLFRQPLGGEGSGSVKVRS